MTPCSAPRNMCCASSCGTSPSPSGSACRCAKSGACKAALNGAPGSRRFACWRASDSARPTIFCCCAPKPARPTRPWPIGGRVFRAWVRMSAVSWWRNSPRPVVAASDVAVVDASHHHPKRQGMSEPLENTARAYIGLGSNLDDPVAQVRSGVTALTRLNRTHVEVCSSLYRTAPVGWRDQPDFVNAVCRVRTGLIPAALMRNLLEIERVHGRVRDLIVPGRGALRELLKVCTGQRVERLKD